MQRAATGLRLCRLQEMEWGPLFVFDHAVDSEDIKTILTLQNAGKIDEKGSSSGTRTPETPHFGIEMSPQIFHGSSLHAKLQATIESRYRCKTKATKRIYITERIWREHTNPCRLVGRQEKKKRSRYLPSCSSIGVEARVGRELCFQQRARGAALRRAQTWASLLSLRAPFTEAAFRQAVLHTRRALVVMFTVKPDPEAHAPSALSSTDFDVAREALTVVYYSLFFRG